MSQAPPDARSRCPICGADTDVAIRPFCSKRCADVDLLRWLRGGYVIEGSNEDADEDGRVCMAESDDETPPKRAS
jgi:endogenous inhibitor of DNA gyrase (YacG/DUF329 family)